MNNKIEIKAADEFLALRKFRRCNTEVNIVTTYYNVYGDLTKFISDYVTSNERIYNNNQILEFACPHSVLSFRGNNIAIWTPKLNMLHFNTCSWNSSTTFRYINAISPYCGFVQRNFHTYFIYDPSHIKIMNYDPLNKWEINESNFKHENNSILIPYVGKWISIRQID